MADTITILFLSNDMLLARNFQERTKSFTYEFVIVPCTSGEKFVENLKSRSVDAVFLDDTFIDPENNSLMSKILSSMRTVEVGTKTPLFLLSNERNLDSIRNIISLGFNDIFTKPIDYSLLFQKLQVYLPKTQFIKDNLLFSMKVDSQLELAQRCQLISASEFGVTICLDRQLVPGEVFTIYGDMLDQFSGKSLSRVIHCTPKQNANGCHFEAFLIFIAPKKDFLSAIRVWIKKEYVRSREAE